MSVTNMYHLPQGLLSAVCLVESGHSIAAITYDDGGSDSLGVCQVKLDTARMLGFKGTAEQLRTPQINAKYAGKYLSKQITRYNKDLSCAVAAYNAGSCLKIGKKIVNQQYVDKVMSAWRSQSYATH